MPTVMPTPPSASQSSEPHSLGATIERLRQRRGSILAFGILSALLGLVALVLVETATIASVLVIGVFMILAGCIEIAVGFRTRSWGRMLLWEAAGVLYLLAGLFAVALPELASVVLTLLLGAGLLATGVLRVVVGFQLAGSPARSGLILAGFVTSLLGVLILVGWPGNSVLVLGTFLGLDLLFYGVSWMLLAYRVGALHRRP